MPKKGDDVLLPAEDLALGTTSPKKGDDVMIHDRTRGRGQSAVSVGDTVAAVTEDRAQGPGGKFLYSVGGGDLRAIESVKTAESHDTFYDFNDNQANHGYKDHRVITVLVHQNTNDGSYALVVTHHDASGTGEDPEHVVETAWSPAVDSSKLIVEDEPESSPGDTYNDDAFCQGFDDAATDGFVIPPDAMESTVDISFTSGGCTHDTTVNDEDMTVLRVIESDGSPPTGGSYQDYNMPATVSLRVNV